MNRYDHHFRALPALVRVNAAQKVGFARFGLIQHRGNGFGPEDDDAIVRQFDLSGMAEFWDVVLSEPMECEDFAHALSVHFMVIEHKPDGTDADRLASGPAASRAVDIVRAQLRSALRQARVDGEPWFMEMPEPPSTKLDTKAWLGFVPSDTYIEPPPPPPYGVDLSRLKVRPRPAVEWLLAMPRRQHLVPPSLVAAITSKVVEAPPAPVAACMPEAETPRSAPKRVRLATAGPARKRGPRPEVGPRVEAEMRQAIRDGVDLGGMKQAEMAARFKAAQSVCRDIRIAILGKAGGN